MLEEGGVDAPADGFHRDIIVRALNKVDEWGPSDHCRLLIEIAGD